MAGLKDHEGPKGEKSPTPPSSPPKQSVNAVKTPPPKPDSGQNFDSEAPTILHSGSAFDAATIIEPSQPAHASEAATMLDAPVRAPSRPAPTPPASNWNASFLLPTGSVLANRYEILDLLGEGGMGAVYKARDNELDRLIALKVIRPELSSNPEILQRFKQELVLARQVTDRNIIRIFDLGEANGMRFITMEYVEGTSLYQILREHGKLGVVESAEIIKQVLSGLKAAHREGAICGKRHFAAEQLVKNQPQGEKIRALIEGAAQRLLRRHIFHGADQGTGLGHPVRFNEPRQSEVHHDDAACGIAHNVLGFQIAMNYIRAMGGFERAAHLQHHVHRLFRREPLLLLDNAAKIAALDVLHGDELHAIGITEVINAHHVLVRHLLGEHKFLLEALEHGRISRQIRPDHLERNQTVHFTVASFIDRTHAAASKNLKNFIPLREHGSDWKQVLAL